MAASLALFALLFGAAVVVSGQAVSAEQEIGANLQQDRAGSSPANARAGSGAPLCGDTALCLAATAAS